ncbi:MAG: hypothetical protein JXR13_18125 [Thalassovita sp.]
MSDAVYRRYLYQAGGKELKIEQEGVAAFALWFDAEKLGVYKTAKQARWQFLSWKEPDAQKRDDELSDLPAVSAWQIEEFDGLNGGANP